MSELKRYDLEYPYCDYCGGAWMDENPSGDYMRSEEVDAKFAEINKLVNMEIPKGLTVAKELYTAWHIINKIKAILEDCDE